MVESFDEEMLRAAYLEAVRSLTDDQLLEVGQRARVTLEHGASGYVIHSRAKLWAARTEYDRRHPKSTDSAALEVSEGAG